MTDYHEVHLFSWIKENAVMIGGAFLTVWALVVWAVTSFFKARDSKFATIEALENTRNKNTREHDEIRKQMANNHDEVKNLFINHLGTKK